MKINTITCHDVYNAGASLQAYALQKYLQNLGHTVEIIHYKPNYLFDYRLWGCDNPRFNKPFLRLIYSLLKFPNRVKCYLSIKKKRFDEFRNKYLKLTQKKYYDIEELRKHPPGADIYFAGSDQIWNSFFQNGRDPAFYLSFGDRETVRASYAASFATASIDEYYKEFVKTEIQNLDYVAVREYSGLKILEGIGIENGCCVVDPVFLLEANRWRKLLPPKVFHDQYILIYSFGSNSIMEQFATKLAQKNNWKIYSWRKNFGDAYVGNSGPLEFLQLIENAEFVLSNSFHATAFSIIFHKEFLVFNRTEAINMRMRDLTDMLGLSDRLVSHSLQEPPAKIDYSEVDNRLQSCISRSKQYIDSVLKAKQ